MACNGVQCVQNAICKETDAGVTCRCVDGFTGNGFKECTKVLGAIVEDDYIYIIVFIVLLFIGLLVILIYFLCRRRILDKTEDEPLVASTENQYDMKWQMVLNDKDVPPSYSDISEVKVEPEPVTTFFVEPQVQSSNEIRVPVKLDEEEDDIPKGIDNPTYDIVEVQVEEGDSEHTSIGVEADDPERAVIYKVYENPMKSEAQDEVEAEGADDVVGQTGDEVPDETNDDEEVAGEPIKITFAENEDAPNTVTATVTTPNANLTINLNINVPSPEPTQEVATEED